MTLNYLRYLVNNPLKRPVDQEKLYSARINTIAAIRDSVGDPDLAKRYIEKLQAYPPRARRIAALTILKMSSQIDVSVRDVFLGAAKKM